MNFFEYIGLANVEKVHSQMIAWIFSSNCKAYSNEAKSNVINELFFPTKDYKYEYFESFTEFSNIDIVIKTDKFLFVIENKFKSFQHSNQLDKYSKIIDNVDESFVRGLKQEDIFLGFLTLTDEKAINGKWKNITYQYFVKALDEQHFSGYNSSHSIILREYIESLKSITEAVEAFRSDHRLFSHVFEDGNKKKNQKISEANQSEASKIISRNQLETTLQRMFWSELTEELKADIKQKLEFETWFYITETRGNALVFSPLSNKREKIEVQEGFIEFHFGFDIQKNTMKINFVPCEESDYKRSDIKWIPEKYETKLLSIKEGLKYQRFNKGRSRAQISITKLMPKKIYEMSKKELVDFYVNEYAKAKKAIDNS
jgi:hypothetical protein